MTNQKPALNTILFPLLLAVVIGALAGLGAVFFRWLIEIGINLFWPGEGGLSASIRRLLFSYGLVSLC